MADESKKDKNEHVVIALFANQPDAETAADGLKRWDGANDEVKLGAIGTILNEKGKVKAHVGRKTGKGAGVGATVGIIAGILSGGLTLVGGMVAGGLTGGAVGTFMKKSLHMTKEEIQALGPELEDGKVALVVTCDEHEVGPTQQWLAAAGGTVRGYSIPTAALEEAVEAGIGADVPLEANPEVMAEAVAAPEASAPEEIATEAAPTAPTDQPGEDGDEAVTEAKPA